MPINLDCPDFPLAAPEVDNLWQVTRDRRRYPDEIVNIRCVKKAIIQDLNQRYRHKNSPTNVLTFSYAGEHDVAICVAIVKEEARQRKLALADYAAWVLVHAFVHVTGLDHEHSVADAKISSEVEKNILQATRYGKATLNGLQSGY